MTYFSLSEARSLLPEIKSITKRYHDQVEKLQIEMTTVSQENAPTVHNKIECLLKGWVIEVLQLGVEVKGIWLVDFDSGDGYYYCWKYNEDDIKYFHRYETGLAGRRPIELLEN